MFKKIIVSTLLALLLAGGVFQVSADASANQAQQPSYQYKIYYSANGSWNQVSNEKLNSLLQNYFSQYNQRGWHQQQMPSKDKAEQQPTVEQKPNKPSKGNNETPKQNNTANQPAEKQKQQKQPQAQSQQLNAFEQEVVELTNQERTKQGLAPLKIDTELSKVARAKSQDMADNNYFSHNSPTYGSPFDMIKQFGVSYRTAGENIARGQRTPQEVVNGWMNSDGHRRNIMNSDFTHIGVGYVKEGNYWTQQFIGK